jgi:hypothetical protein
MARHKLMAHIANPQNFDIDDDAIFAGLLMQGLVWIEEDNEDELNADFDIDNEEILDETRTFIHDHGDDWVNFSHVSRHLYETFGKNIPKRLWENNGTYTSLTKFFAAFPEIFQMRKDDTKTGLFWIRRTAIDKGNYIYKP